MQYTKDTNHVVGYVIHKEVIRSHDQLTRIGHPPDPANHRLRHQLASAVAKLLVQIYRSAKIVLGNVLPDRFAIFARNSGPEQFQV